MLEKLVSLIAQSGTTDSIIPAFKTGDYCLYQNDNLAVMAKLPDNHVDMIFADPPYKLSNNGVTCQAGKMVNVNKGEWDSSKGFDDDLQFHETWISECFRILKPEGTIWVSGTNHSIYMCGFLMQKLNLHILNDIAWFKPNAAPNLACNTFAHSHETLLWARKHKKALHTFNYELMKKGSFPEDKMKVREKQMRSVWSIPTPAPQEKEFGKHPAQKPLALLKRIILASTKENDLILDPFNGSGTTGIACKIIGNRNYIGIEINEEFIEQSILRYKKLINRPQ